MKNGDVNIYTFDRFCLDPEERRLLFDDEPVQITPKAFDVLAYLVENSSHLVTKNEIMEAIWPDSFVEEANLTRIVHTLRKTLDPSGKAALIETVPKKGYRFAGEVNRSLRSASDSRPNTDHSAPFGDEFSGPDLEVVEKDAEKNDLWRFPLAVMAGAIIIAAGFFFYQSIPGSSIPQVSIAVLPFRAISSVNTDEAYEFGFADAVIVQLAGSNNILVRPLSAVRAYRDQHADPLAAGIQQRTEYVLDSSYLIASGRLRVTSQLMNVASGKVENTFVFEESESDMLNAGFSIATKIGNALTEKFDLQTNGNVAVRGTYSDDAYRLYLRGMYLTDKRIREDAEKALSLFEQAVQIDPTYARGHYGLAYAHTSIYVNGGEGSTHCQSSISSAQRAIDLDPNLAEAYSILAMNQHSCLWDQKAAELTHQRALALAPNSSTVHRFYGVFLTHAGRGAESIAEIKKAIDLDPNLLWNEKMLGRALFFARRYDEAIRQLMTVKELDPNDDEQNGFLVGAFVRKADTDQALEWFLKDSRIRNTGEEKMSEWRALYGAAGWPGVLLKSLEIAEQAERDGGKNYGTIARLSAQVGDKEKAFANIEKLSENPGLFMAQIMVDPDLDPLRDDPRFNAVLRRFNFRP